MNLKNGRTMTMPTSQRTMVAAMVTEMAITVKTSMAISARHTTHRETVGENVSAVHASTTQSVHIAATDIQTNVVSVLRDSEITMKERSVFKETTIHHASLLTDLADSDTRTRIALHSAISTLHTHTTTVEDSRKTDILVRDKTHTDRALEISKEEHTDSALKEDLSVRREHTIRMQNTA